MAATWARRFALLGGTGALAWATAGAQPTVRQTTAAAAAAAPGQPPPPHHPSSPHVPGLPGTGVPGCRVCTDFRKTAAAIVTHTEAAAAGSTATKAGAAEEPLPCPPDGGELGRATWTFLHTTAAYYPEHPTPEQQASMRQLVHHFAQWYPCQYCAEHLRAYLAQHPVDVSSSDALSLWMCRMVRGRWADGGRKPYEEN